MPQKIAKATVLCNSYLQLPHCYFVEDDEMMDAADSPRVAKLRNIIKKHASVAAFARAYDLDVTYIRQLLNGHRNLGEKASRRLGEKIANDPLLLEDRHTDPLSDQEHGQLDAFRRLSESGREEIAMFARLKAQAEVMSENNCR